MKFDVVARFRETIPTVKSILSCERSRKISGFDRNYDFTFFSENLNFPEFQDSRLNENRAESPLYGELYYK